MIPNEKINAYQFLLLVILFSIGTSILIIPSILAGEVKQDAWIVAILGTLIGLLIIWLYCIIGQWFPQLTFVQINEKILGKWVGKLTSLVFVIMSFIYAATLLFYSGTFLNIHFMPDTPMAALNILMTIIIVMGVYLGIETIARSAEVFILVFIVLFFILIVFIIPEIKLENIQPIFESNPKMIFKSSLSVIEVTSINAIVLLMIFPAFINDIKKGKKFFFIGNLIGGIMIIILTLLCILVLGAYGTAEEIFPGYKLAKRINVGDFIQRIESLMSILWIIALYFKTTAYFYASVLGITQIFNLKNYRPLTMPLGGVVVVLSLVLYPNVVYQKTWNETIGLLLSFSVGLFIPLLLVVVYFIRKKQLKKESEGSEVQETENEENFLEK